MDEQADPDDAVAPNRPQVGKALADAMERLSRDVARSVVSAVLENF